MRIGFIGAGKMAQALARGFINNGKVLPTNIMASAPKEDVASLEYCEKLGLGTTHDNTEVVQGSDVIFLAVKPHYISKVASEIAPKLSRDKLVVSIALGITLRNMESILPSKSKVVRVMPNTPAVVGAGATAYCLGGSCRDSDGDTVNHLLSTVGYAVEVPEDLLDPITGLSGSGPSFMFSVIEGLADGGVKAGLPRDLSIKLAACTLMGAGKMVLETGIHPGQLKDDVQSPGGSSVYGIHQLEKGGLKATLINAVEAATNRSREIGTKSQPKELIETPQEEESSEETHKEKDKYTSMAEE